MTKLCKFYGIDKVGIVDLTWNPFKSFYWFDKDKSYLPYIETHVIDSCNLNCKRCGHLAQLFTDEDFYSLEKFERDIKQISECIDLMTLRLMGGEPFKSKNLDQYVKIARKYLPQANIMVVSNGLLIPSAPQKFFDAMRENQCSVWVSVYKPTIKLMDKIERRLRENEIPLRKDGRAGDGYIGEFFSILSLKSGDIKVLEKIPEYCQSKICKFLRNGKLYKCPMEAFSFKFSELGAKNFPKSAELDIYNKNFPLLLDMLMSSTMVGTCNYCQIPVFHDWEIKNTIDLEDLLVDPAEKELLKTS